MAVKQSAIIRRILTHQCARLGIPVSGTFELTPRCNLQCKMCYIRLTPAEMAPIGQELTAKEWLQIGRDAVDAGMVFLLITGGEPTLRPDFSEIYEGLTQMGLSISINTNGTLLSPTLREVWHRLPPASVNITLYGVCREDYGALCSNPDAFDAVVDALDWLQAEGILVHLNTTIVPANCGKWLQIEEFSKARGLELRMTSYCFPPARRTDDCGACPEFSRLSPEAAAEMILRDIYYRNGAEAIKRHAANMSAPPHEDCGLNVGDPIQCMAGSSQFWLTWDGRLVPCGMLSTPVTRPLVQGFSPAWDELREKTAAIRLCPDCAACEERRTCLNCVAVVYTETGCFDGRPEYMCRLNHAYREQLVQLANKL